MANLIICANHIGDISDIPPKTIEAIKRSKNIICDTKRMFVNNILIPLDIPYFDKNIIEFVSHIDDSQPIFDFATEHLSNDEEVLFICDFGLPGVSDWGARLVSYLYENNYKVNIITGPSIVSTALAISGIEPVNYDVFFGGFMSDTEQQIEDKLKALKPLTPTLVLIDHPSRIDFILRTAQDILGDIQASLCIDLTLPTQNVIKSNLSQLRLEYAKLDTDKMFVTLVMGFLTYPNQ
jgi:16S rRNA (cytidine1402-2'-O)-methyltransferase